MKKVMRFIKNKEFQKRLWFTVFILVVYEFGSMISLPNVNREILQSMVESNSFVQLLNMVGGGSLDRMSLFALGVTPYITASIVVQLMASDVIPALTRMKDQGLKGQNKLDRVTRILTIILAFVQGYGIVLMLSSSTPVVENGTVTLLSMLEDTSVLGTLYVCLLMVAGSMIAIWFGDLLTMHGLGNGASMIICAGILMRMPTQLASIYTTLVGNGDIATFIGYLVSILVLIIAIVVLQLSERHIPIWDPSSRISAVNDKESNYLPLKVNTPGVMPIIFASSLMMVPLQILQMLQKSDWYTEASKFLGLESWYSVAIYALLVVFFSFFYAKIQINPEKVAENLTKGGTFIPGYQPGKETEIYVSKTLNHIMVFGAIALMIVATIPYLLPMFTSLTSSTAIGGTSILIIVGVLIELRVQVRGLLHKDRYEQFRVQ